MEDFLKALEEIPPAFGTDNSTLDKKLLGGFFNYSPSFGNLYDRCQEFLDEINSS